MRRQTKKLTLTLLLSVALISTNMQFVSAQEESLQNTDTALENQSSDESASSQDAEKTENSSETEQAEQTGQTGETSQTEQTSQTGETSQTEQTGQTGETSQTEQTNQAGVEAGTTESKDLPGEGGDNPITGTTGENEAGSTEGGVQEGETTTQNPEDAGTSEGEDGTIADDTAAADGQTGEEEPETPFINKDGEEILPSTLVGVDYNTIADSYDGETNAIKQYIVSDEYAKDTITQSYIDENGNLVMVISQGAAESTVEEEKTFAETAGERLASVFGESNSAPAVDGSFTGWDDVPPSYEFNWNKPDAWVDGVHYTETNSTDVRHEMKLYSDGENVYLKVVFAREFSNGQVANGNDYQFWIDNEQMAAYQVQWADGNQLSYNTAEPGVYQVEVRHRDSSWSYVLTDGAVAYYHINDGNLNNELELKIPLSEFVKQNPNINLDNYSMISFFTPNLMQDKISTAGSPTGAEPFAAAVFLLVPTSYIWLKKKDDKEDMAFA